jgi:rsbT co-antagonist protein RsbR
MSSLQLKQISSLIEKHEEEILSDWMRSQRGGSVFGGAMPKEGDLKEQSRALLRSLKEAMAKAASIDITTPEWETVRENLAATSRSNARDGASPTETATAIFSLKQPVFIKLAAELGSNPKELSEQIWSFSALLDKLGLYTAEVYLKSREQVIARQQQEMMELSTPVVELWRGILALPLIGTLDSQRTQVVMENLLQKIADTGAPIAIIDITGVPTVDTLVAQHLIKTISAARLMGADCIISGIRPQIAQTIVHLGVALGDVLTKSTLADAFAIALKRTGLAIATNHSA